MQVSRLLKLWPLTVSGGSTLKLRKFEANNLTLLNRPEMHFVVCFYRSKRAVECSLETNPLVMFSPLVSQNSAKKLQCFDHCFKIFKVTLSPFLDGGFDHQCCENG